MLRSKLKEAWVCLKAGRVTLPYPLGPAPAPPEGFRGKLDVDVEACIGCGACANACPSRLILVEDHGYRRTLDFSLERCTYCARCAEVCPEGAVFLTPEFELATGSREDLHIHLEVYMATCRRCGRCYSPASPLDRLMITGMRDGEGR